MYFIKMSNHGVRTQCESASHAKEKFQKIQKAVTRKKKPKANCCK